MELTSDFEWGFDPDKPQLQGILDRLRARGFPRSAIRPDGTLDMKEAGRHGWHITNGELWFYQENAVTMPSPEYLRIEGLCWCTKIGEVHPELDYDDHECSPEDRRPVFFRAEPGDKP